MFRHTEPAASLNPLQNLKSLASSSFAQIAITSLRIAFESCQHRRFLKSEIGMRRAEHGAFHSEDLTPGTPHVARRTSTSHQHIARRTNTSHVAPAHRTQHVAPHG